MSTKTLDHIVHLTPPGTVEETSQQFRKLGFKVIDGGVHADGLTANSLVVLGDNVYIELISKRESHKWAAKSPGWIDYAFLGNGSMKAPDRISDIVNDRRGSSDRPLYLDEVAGGRTRPDGEVLKWVITSPAEANSVLPFFCGDVTDRHLRVPTEPASNCRHPCGALGIAHIVLLTSESNFAALSNELSVVIASPPLSRTATEARWLLSTLNGRHPTTLILSTASDQEQVQITSNNSNPVIYEVGFWVGEDGEEGSVSTPFGRVVWVTQD
ncbi:glyoxalase-like domain-containing protein [Mycena sp. CBHHK59/15]|nr:glyoxalase-like domain-containing protein [Mycena sp. CBHHK59/15]